MICHIVFESEYSFRYFQLIEKYFSLNGHYFIIHGKGLNLNQKNYKYKNSFNTKDFSEKEVIGLLEKADSIIINGFFSRAITDVFFCNPQYLKKVSWLTWGDDIFRFKETDFEKHIQDVSFKEIIQQIRLIKRNIQLSLKLRMLPLRYGIHELQRSFVIKNMANILGIEKDFLMIKNIYKTKARYIYAFHPFIIDWDNLNKYIELTNVNRKENHLNILVGNSGSISNKHVEAFELIGEFAKNNRIEIYAPLSYGDLNNINKVIESGRKIFGELFHPITEIMTTSEYMKFLAKINLAIMNHNIQEGIGTIITLLLLGVKVYIRSNISSYDFLTKRGIKVFDVDDIKKNASSLEDLIFYDEATKDNNKKAIIKEFSELAWSRTWNKIFKQISNN